VDIINCTKDVVAKVPNIGRDINELVIVK
ncbi:transaldolase, partial [Mammaliicoccus sciuri]